MKSTDSGSDFMKHVHAAMVVIRHQRQRASLERICRSLRLQQMLKNLDEKMVEAELEAAVERGELFAVDKRGYRSYQVQNFPFSGFCWISCDGWLFGGTSLIYCYCTHYSTLSDKITYQRGGVST